MKQDKADCEIVKVEEGKNFLEVIGYNAIMNIKENDIVYGKDGLNLAIKDIEKGDKLIEVECSKELDTVEKLKQKINELQIPIETDNYFVKKAEIELEKSLRN